MADKQISSLPAATSVDDASLFVVEQQGRAMSASGALWKGFAVQSVQPFANNASASAAAAANSATQAANSASNAAGSAQNAENSADAAAESAKDAADAAESAKEYSGKPPIVQDDTWWTWDASKQEYVNTGESARGDVLFATFEIDPKTGLLTMQTPEQYSGPVFSIVNGYMEVSISA